MQTTQVAQSMRTEGFTLLIIMHSRHTHHLQVVLFLLDLDTTVCNCPGLGRTPAYLLLPINAHFKKFVLFFSLCAPYVQTHTQTQASYKTHTIDTS